ncbi:MAG: CPBP family intramembrane metalloprotease [Ruminococcaceae bacterium]|nr:CPBP family intramembrane metalloprotease [Oscillospiraceae bacterium]
MAKERTPDELQYRGTVNRIAWAMLIFEALFSAVGVLIAVIALVLDEMAVVGLAYDLVAELSYGFLYAAIFLLPILFFRLFSKKAGTVPVFGEIHVPRDTVLYLMAGLALISATAQINAMLVSLFDVSASVESIFGSEVTGNHQLILMIFTTAVVPAFVEEFLFRGMVLSNLLPYGKSTAILGSALLFGVMHQNPAQLLYATAAGLVLGYLYVKVRSIWPCVLLHLFNNFLSVIQIVMVERMPEQTANIALSVMQGVIFLVGIVSAILLLLRHRETRREILAEGSFEKDPLAEPSEATASLSFGQRVKHFFTVPMIIFFAICVVMMLMPTLLTALLF